MSDMYMLSDYLKDSVNKDFIAGYVLATEYDKVQAFAAIRRAAEWARSADKHGGPSNEARAALVRQVIRAAIGSEKA